MQILLKYLYIGLAILQKNVRVSMAVFTGKAVKPLLWALKNNRYICKPNMDITHHFPHTLKYLKHEKKFFKNNFDFNFEHMFCIVLYC